ncbi:DNA excision repair protein ERCC-1 isoform X2 [Mercurialis annua]|uniref:DNA excision repair protein ERCC-1 isoform X2 n=1 Tax=Mercurialis annua TaxID=3986 RepID=UPI00215F474B|nr:DNA excision repair protein ERCC-1 isoform X2 [Mercurialis annua]
MGLGFISLGPVKQCMKARKQLLEVGPSPPPSSATMERDENDEEQNRKSNTKKVLIQIPSYQEVIENSQNPKTQSLFNPSQTFSQAFASIKNSEFYTPPPPPKSGAVSDNENSNPTSTTQSAASPSPSAASPSNHAGQNRNAIIVSHSLRYHLLHPDYLYYRIRELQKNYKLRIVLCHVDVEDVVKPLLEVTKTALLHDCTLLCAWSLEECGRYLETIKIYENKPADLIQGYMDTDYLSRLSHSLTTVRHVNKTDVVTLGSTFGSLSNIMDASMEDLARCPGIGERKVKRLYDTFHEPFKRVSSNPIVPETSQKDPEPSVAKITELGKGEEDESKRRKKEPEITVKSALSAAFSKYADKIGKRANRSHGEKDAGETSLGKESGTDNRNSNEETGS